MIRRLLDRLFGPRPQPAPVPVTIQSLWGMPAEDVTTMEIVLMSPPPPLIELSIEIQFEEDSPQVTEKDLRDLMDQLAIDLAIPPYRVGGAFPPPFGPGRAFIVD